LWRVYVIDGLQNGQVSYCLKAHHAALDGQAGVLLARAVFDLTPRPRAVGRAPSGECADIDVARRNRLLVTFSRSLPSATGAMGPGKPGDRFT
jgi:hypothetical protein